MGRPKSLMTRRLSKPRTITSPSETSIDLSSPFASSDPDYFGGHPVVTSSRGDKRSSGRSRSRIRAYLYGSSRSTSPSYPSDDESDRRNSIASAAREAKNRLSRTGSSIMQLSSAKASTNYLSCASTANLPYAADTEEGRRIVEEIKEKAYLDTLVAESHVSPPFDDEGQSDSFVAPVRRKSLYTPGLATRYPNDILCKPAPPRNVESRDNRDYYYNPAYPESSPLAALAALTLNEEGRSTPNSFKQIGGLQLGTLRVTNENAISAVDSDGPSRPQTSYSENFETATEGSCSGGRDTPVNRRRSASLSSIQASPKYDLHNYPASSRRSSLEIRPANLKLPPPTSPLCPAATMADEYMAELGESPFKQTEFLLPEPSPAACSVCEDEGISMKFRHQDSWTSLSKAVEPTEPIGQTQVDAYAKLTGEATQLRDEMKPHPVETLVHGPGSDSGYSSTTSAAVMQSADTPTKKSNKDSKKRRSILRPRRRSKAPPLQHTKSENDATIFSADAPALAGSEFRTIPFDSLPDAYKLPSSALETDPAEVSARSSRQLLGRRLQKGRPKSQPPIVDSHPTQNDRDLAQAQIPRVPSVIWVRHAERLLEFPLLEHTFPSSDHTNLLPSPQSFKVQPVPIRFPSPAHALEAATTGPGAISAEGSLSPHSDTSMQHCKSVLPMDVHGTNIVKPSDRLGLGSSQGKKLQKRLVKEQKEHEKKIAKEEKEIEKQLIKERKQLDKQRKDRGRERSLSRPRSWIRGRSSERRMSDVETTTVIADFGTVTEALGKGPYDIAALTKSGDTAERKASRGSRRSSQERRSNAALHQTGNYLVTENALNQQIPRAVHDREPRHGRHISDPRHERVTRAGFDDRGGLPGKSLRPQSMITDVPPVPALPSAHEVQRREWAQSRPQIMIVDTPIAGLPVETAHNVRQNVQDNSNASQQRIGNMPDLWSNGSIEKRHSSAFATMETTAPSFSSEPQDVYIAPSAEPAQGEEASQEVDIWEGARAAWRKRRQSAGEALSQKSITELRSELAKSATNGTLDPKPQNNNTLPTPAERRARPPQALRNTKRRVASSGGARQLPQQQQHDEIPLDTTTTTTTNIDPALPLQPLSANIRSVERFSGRYNGGFLYGYEPGVGLNGSAGTRNSLSEASRKGMMMSCGYGVDLSDVPVFVAPSTAPGFR